MSDELKIGDVVNLKSGGPPVTVISTEREKATDTLWCRVAWWSNGDNCFHDDRFPSDALVNRTEA